MSAALFVLALLQVLPILPAPIREVLGAINPAVMEVTLATTVCRSGWTATVRPPASYTNTLKRQQMQLWGLTGPPSAYEEDHRVPLEIGGAPCGPTAGTCLNLWPQPWGGPENAHQKDRLENAVHRDLCARPARLTLAQAQAVFLGDWRAELRRRFPGLFVK